jgi:NAD(P)-dependent dehydrogenase (short-subunit alcohol dehydrogenase family)
MSYRPQNSRKSKFATEPSDTEFTGKLALVTGGTRVIGAAIVHRLSRAGATVVTTARSTPQDLLQPELFVAADLGTAEGAETVVSAVRERLGGIDILIHNVGESSAPGGGFAALTDDDWQQALTSNLLAAVRLDRGLLPLMVAQGAGAIIHISSIQRRLPLFEATLAYAAAKAALST